MFLTFGLDSSSVDITRSFYERLGLNFSSEQHGDRGLPHFSTIVQDFAVEVYPTIKALPSADRLFIGFEVDDPVPLGDELIERFGGVRVEPPIPVTHSGIVTLRDPNGLLIRLFHKMM